jgi:ring-1,2-phenylacetyl-CoA epoxidase subunit PaaE
MSQFHKLKVKDIQRETRDAVVVTFDVPAGLASDFRFIQGQYLTLRTTIDGEEVRRSYSICSGVQDSHLRVAIKRVADGVFSSWAQEMLKPGAFLEAAPPEGRFHMPLEPAARRHYLALAAGSGITPILSIMKTTLAAEPGSRFTLVYGNRSSSSVLFGQELGDLKDLYLERVNLIYIMSREQQDIDLFNGRIDADKCAELFARWIPVGDVDGVFVCGPEAMTRSVLTVLEEHGLPRTSIKAELFGTDQPVRAPRPVQAGPGIQATAIIDGRAREFEIDRGGETILDAALRQGVELPYSCKGGVCSTCRAHVVEGEVDMDVHFGLEDYEIARGYILTCQSYPAGDRVVVDFDNQH